MKHFKETTFGRQVIMGRKTFESLPSPLIGRLNIVLSSKNKYVENAEASVIFGVRSIQDALGYGPALATEPKFIIGGAQIYEQVLSLGLIDVVVLTRIPNHCKHDVKFPFHFLKDFNLTSIKTIPPLIVEYYARRTQNELSDFARQWCISECHSSPKI